MDVLDRLRLARHPVEVRRAAHVRRVRRPTRRARPPGTGRSRHCSSPVKTSAYVRVNISFCTDVGDDLVDLLRRRPEVVQVDVVPVVVLAERLVEEVDVHASGERVRDDERRRREVVRLHLGMDARLEVAVAGEDGADDEVALGDRLGDLVRQRPRVADARRAAVADGVEAELVEVAVEPGLLVVLGDDLRAGRERRLHPRLPLEAALDGVLREQPGARPSPAGSTCSCTT